MARFIVAAVHAFDVRSPGLNLAPANERDFEHYRSGKNPKADPAFQVERIWAKLASQASATSRNEPGVLHGDFWPGNILWRDGSLVAVIDWEEAKMGDPLQDLSICRLDLWWIFDREAMESFTQCYLVLNPVDTTLLPLWDLRTALRPVTNLAQWATAYGPLGRPDITVDHMRRIHARFVAQAFAALEAAAP